MDVDIHEHILLFNGTSFFVNINTSQSHQTKFRDLHISTVSPFIKLSKVESLSL